MSIISCPQIVMDSTDEVVSQTFFCYFEATHWKLNSRCYTSTLPFLRQRTTHKMDGHSVMTVTLSANPSHIAKIALIVRNMLCKAMMFDEFLNCAVLITFMMSFWEIQHQFTEWFVSGRNIASICACNCRCEVSCAEQVLKSFN